MGWVLRVGRVRGVPVEVHWLFAPFLLWAALQGWAQAGGARIPPGALTDPARWDDIARVAARALPGGLLALGLLVVVFASVLLHEIGHTVQAQALGIPVRRIVLLPIGGLAELARLPERPADELRVAAAGPACNLALALAFGAIAFVSTRLAPLSSDGLGSFLSRLWVYIALANAGLGLFNLVPAFPMDGGRILRSLLALAFNRLLATRLVSALSWIIGGIFIVLGLGLGQAVGVPPSLGLALVGALTWVGGGFEQSMEANRQVLRHIQARIAVRQPTWTLAPTDAVTPSLAALAFSLSGKPALPVVVGARVVGMLTRRDVEHALRRAAPVTVAHLMRTRFPYVHADEDLWRAQQLLLGTELGALPVLEGDTLRGVLTANDIHVAQLDPPAPLRVETPTYITGGNPSV